MAELAGDRGVSESPAKRLRLTRIPVTSSPYLEGKSTVARGGILISVFGGEKHPIVAAEGVARIARKPADSQPVLVGRVGHLNVGVKLTSQQRFILGPRHRRTKGIASAVWRKAPKYRGKPHLERCVLGIHPVVVKVLHVHAKSPPLVHEHVELLESTRDAGSFVRQHRRREQHGSRTRALCPTAQT